MKIESDRVVFWQGWLALLILPVAVGMGVAAGPHMWSALQNTSGFSAGIKAFLICFCAAWFGILIWTVYQCLTRFCQTVTIDQEGVRRRRLFSRLELTWSEIGDWGFVRNGKTVTLPQDGRPHSRQTYVLYFSREPVERGRVGGRRFRGDVVRVMLSGYEYDRVMSSVIPLCEGRSMIQPVIER